MIGKFKVRKDRVLVVDFELTCWEGEVPSGEMAEIIEIGLSEVDVETLEIKKTDSYLVKPEYSTISEYCTNLTGITPQRMRKQGRALGDVANTLKKNWGSASKAWMAWGNDREAIMLDCMRKQIENPFSEAYHNIGQQFSMMVGATSSIGLNKAFEMMGIERTGAAHTAAGDAEDTACLWVHLTQRIRTELFPSDNFEMQTPSH